MKAILPALAALCLFGATPFASAHTHSVYDRSSASEYQALSPQAGASDGGALSFGGGEDDSHQTLTGGPSGGRIDGN